ncbi:hypothetical protein TNCV_3978351 [Trichonephila clavipes]|nr:hypothetical protein TNCV_3978351 [Trichonephila clavipes]
MPVLSAVIDRGPFRASTAPPYYHPEPIDSIFCKLSVDPRRTQAAILQYDKPQSQYSTIRPFTKSNTCGQPGTIRSMVRYRSVDRGLRITELGDVPVYH